VTDTVRPTAAEDTDWLVCPGCHQLIYRKRLDHNLKVCPGCGRHHRLTAPERLAQLLDPDSAEPIEVPSRLRDPLEFVDSEPYRQRWAAARDRTGLPEAAIVAAGRIQGQPVVAVVMDFRFLGGSLGAGVGEVVTAAADLALRRRVPLLLVTASGGARMQEGALALMQMVKTSQALGQLDEAGILTVSLVTDPTYGGVAASFATLADVIIAEPGARLGFAGPRVIAQTIRQTLPTGFQTAEFLLARGLIDAVGPRHALRSVLGRTLGVGGRRGRDSGVNAADAVLTDGAYLPEVQAWEAVKRARNLQRPTTLDYLSRVFEDFLELRGDRVSGDCAAVVGGLARLAGMPVVVIGHQKGRTAAELITRNYGMPEPAGYRKAARLCRLAAKLGLPVITFVDTPGAYPGITAEEAGQAIAVAESIRLMAGLPVPIISVVTGEGGSGGALALAVADRVLMCAGAVYSVISPEGCAAILWNDPAAAPRAAEALQLDARRLLDAGLVDGVIPEPPGGAQTDHRAAAALVHDALVVALRRLVASNPARLVASRRRKFSRFGSDVRATPEAMA
jgi:acetyl-CoA carboxylase carboxyl transferase subunit beta